MSPSLSSQVRRATAPAGWALRAYWGTAVLLAAAAGIGLVATLPVTALVGRVRAPLARVADLGLGRSSLATGPNELRAAATADLFHLLLLVAMGVLCVASLSLLAVAFARGGSRVSELAVRRAVGASRRLILVAALIEGGVIAAAALATFGAGFVLRPFGAIFFGRFGDMIGRKFAFLVTLLIMGGSTAAIGILPTYARIGLAAPIILVVLRLLQGLALGGEYGGAAVYVAEHSPDEKRGYYTSFIQTTATLGLFISLIVILVVRRAVGEDAASAGRKRCSRW